MSKEVIKTHLAVMQEFCTDVHQHKKKSQCTSLDRNSDFVSIWSQNQVLLLVKNNKNTPKMQKTTNTSMSYRSSACVKPGFSLPRLIKKEQPENVCKTDCYYKVH